MTEKYIYNSTDYDIPADVDNKIKFSVPSTPLTRRRQIGDLGKYVDADGYWVYITTDREGIPTESRLIEVSGNVHEWNYVGEDTKKIIERLPRIGLFVFLY